MASLKFLIDLPKVFPNSGRRLGPKMSNTIPKISRCSTDIPNILWVYKGLAVLSILVTAGSPLQADEIKPKAPNSYQMVTGDDSDADRSQWDRIYKTAAYVFGKEPAVFVKDHIDLLPIGRALDIAMGEGRIAPLPW